VSCIHPNIDKLGFLSLKRLSYMLYLRLALHPDAYAARLTDSQALMVYSLFDPLLATNDCMPPVGLKVALSCVRDDQHMLCKFSTRIW